MRASLTSVTEEECQWAEIDTKNDLAATAPPTLRNGKRLRLRSFLLQPPHLPLTTTSPSSYNHLTATGGPLELHDGYAFAGRRCLALFHSLLTVSLLPSSPLRRRMKEEEDEKDQIKVIRERARSVDVMTVEYACRVVAC